MGFSKRKGTEKSFGAFGFEMKCISPENVARESTPTGVVVRIECRGCAGPSDLTNPGCLHGTILHLRDAHILTGVRLHGLMESEYHDVGIRLLALLSSMSSDCGRISELSRGHICPKNQECALGADDSIHGMQEMLVLKPENFYSALIRLENQLASSNPVSEICKTTVSDARASLNSIRMKLEEMVLIVWEHAFARMNIDTKTSGWIERPGVMDDPSRLPRGISGVFNTFRRSRPAFSQAWVNLSVPAHAKQPPIETYNVGSARIDLYELTNRPERLYHIFPREYDLAKFSLDQIKIVEALKQELTERIPPDFDLTRPDLAREYAKKFAKEHVRRIARTVKASLDDLKDASAIEEVICETLAKYTAGLGVSETFVTDTNLTDLYIDSPVEANDLYVVLGGSKTNKGKSIAGRYISNVRLTDADSKGLLSRFRYESGRPFSEANPVLECDIDEFECRATVIGAPFSPKGLAFAIRKHSKEPWTMLRLINNRSISPLGAGLISFLIHGQSTILVAGSRGAGKSSLLGAMMLEFPPHQRILTIEDTMELPVWEMQALGYHIQPMLVQSSLGGYGEKTADDALRVALRLGESAIVLGEVRGQKETATLYEAMRAGTAGSSVMGTIHGNSPDAVHQRVVSDMKIPETSFSATDIIVVAGLKRPAGASFAMRRVDCISETIVRDDTKIEFHDLMTYDPATDALLPTKWFYESARIKHIAEMFSLTPDQAAQHIWARAAVRYYVTQMAERRTQLLSANHVLKYNNKYQELVDRYGLSMDCRKAVEEWKGWFNELAQFA